MKTLKINSESGKLNLNDLPYNCIFNKKITGCGGTTIALFNSENYIIAVPTKELIINKTDNSEAGISTITNYDGKEQTVFGLFGTFSYYLKKQVKEYLATEGTKKIICTYDKVEALTKLLNTADFRILIDEYQVLLKAYSYRKKAINGVINHFREFKSFCFMSATPISADFKPEFLEEVEEVEAVWNETDKLKVNLIETNKPYVTVANIINTFLTDGISVEGIEVGELFFFLNSVQSIADILAHCHLSPEQVKIVCANEEQNRIKLAGYDIVNSKAPNKPITFITSCSFEGADYFSEKGLSFIVSNCGNSHTQLDIATDIYQIAGRIRTESNPFRTKLMHIYSTAGSYRLNLDITYSEMVDMVKEQEEGAKAILDVINNNPKAASMASKMINDSYIIKNGDTYILNDMLIKLELFNYNINQQIYKSGISLASNYAKNGIMTCGNDEPTEEDEDMARRGNKISFKKAYLKYSEIRNNKYDMEDTSILEKIQPLIVKAYNILGDKEVRRLRYIKKDIEGALESVDTNKSIENKIAKLLKSRLRIGFNSTSTIQAILAEIYATLGLNKVVKATAIEPFYECVPTTKRIDEKKTRGYEIYRPKIVFK